MLLFHDAFNPMRPKNPRRIDLERVWPFSCLSEPTPIKIIRSSRISRRFRISQINANRKIFNSQQDGAQMYRKALNLCIMCELGPWMRAPLSLRRRGSWGNISETLSDLHLSGPNRQVQGVRGGPFVVLLTQNTPPLLSARFFLEVSMRLWPFHSAPN